MNELEESYGTHAGFRSFTSSLYHTTLLLTPLLSIHFNSKTLMFNSKSTMMALPILLARYQKATHVSIA